MVPNQIEGLSPQEAGTALPSGDTCISIEERQPSIRPTDHDSHETVEQSINALGPALMPTIIPDEHLRRIRG